MFQDGGLRVIEIVDSEKSDYLVLLLFQFIK